MRDVLVLLIHVLVTAFRLTKPGGFRSVIAESALLRHQLLILNRGRKRAPNLHVSDRIIAGFCTLLMRPTRILRSSIVLRPSTLLHFHQMLIKRKYRMLPDSRGTRSTAGTDRRRNNIADKRRFVQLAEALPRPLSDACCRMILGIRQRHVDKYGQTVDFLLSERRDVSAAKRFFSRAIRHICPPKFIW